MQHLMFLIYILSLSCGLSAITLGSFLYYFKYSYNAFRYVLIIDLFLTVIVVLDTLNLYRNLFAVVNWQWDTFLFYSTFSASIGIGYFLTLATSAMIGDNLSKQKKAAFFCLAGCTFLAVLLLHLLDSCGIIHNYIRIAAFTTTAFPAVFVFYNSMVLWNNKEKLSKEIRTLIMTVAAAIIVILTATLVIDLLIYAYQLGYPIVLSPVIYFMVNIIFLGFIVKYFFYKPRATAIETQPAPAGAQSDSYEEFCTTYGISGRELEVILLIIAGNSNQDIAQQLYISLHTVRNHTHNIYRKLGINKRYELINIMNR